MHDWKDVGWDLPPLAKNSNLCSIDILVKDRAGEQHKGYYVFFLKEWKLAETGESIDAVEWRKL